MGRSRNYISPTRAPDDVEFARCIRCGAGSPQGLCPKCSHQGRALRLLGKEPCIYEGCLGPRLTGQLVCKRHTSGEHHARAKTNPA